MPFPIHPRIGKTKSRSSREKKGGGGGTSHTVPWVSPNNGVGSILFTSEWRHLPGYPHPTVGSQVRQRRERVAGAVARIFGNLLMPGDHLSVITAHTGRGGRRRAQAGNKQTTCSVLGRKGVTPGLGGRGAWRALTNNRSKMDA